MKKTVIKDEVDVKYPKRFCNLQILFLSERVKMQ